MKENIGNYLRIIRNYHGLTLRQLGNKTGIIYTKIAKYEQQQIIPTNHAISSLENVLGVKFEEFHLISKKIDKLFDDFLESLFYHDQNLEYYRVKISEGKKLYDINYSYGKAKLMDYILLIHEGDFKIARTLEKNLLEDFDNEYEYKAILYQYIGLIYRLEKHYAKAISWFEKAEPMMLNRKNRAMLMIHSSVAYTEIGDIVKATQYVSFAHKIFSEYGSFRRVSYCFVEYGLLLKANKKYSQAIDCFNIALKSMEIINTSDDLIAKVYRNMCWTMILAGNYKTALEYLGEAETYDPKHGFTILYGIWCNYKLKNYDEAEEIINKNIHLKKDVNFARFYDLFNLLVKFRENKPSNELIKVAAEVVNDIKDTEEVERVNFYIDIVLDLLNQSENKLEKLKFLEMNRNLTR